MNYSISFSLAILIFCGIHWFLLNVYSLKTRKILVFNIDLIFDVINCATSSFLIIYYNLVFSKNFLKNYLENSEVQISIIEYCFSIIIFILWIKIFNYLRYIEKYGIFIKIIIWNFTTLFSVIVFSIFFCICFAILFNSLFYSKYT